MNLARDALISDFWLPELRQNKCLFLQTTKCVLICYKPLETKAAFSCTFPRRGSSAFIG